MNGRERALAALAHRQPDRLPIDFGGRHTTIHLQAHQALMRHLGLAGPEPRIRSYHTYLVEPDPQLVSRFGRVATPIFPNAPSDYLFRIDPVTNTYADEWGATYYMPPGGYYYDLQTSPLAAAEAGEDLRRYRWPNPADPSRFAGLPERIKAAHEAVEGLTMICSATGGPFEQAWYLLGFEQAYVSLATNLPFMEDLTERLVEWQIDYWNSVLDLVAPYADIVQIQEDLGSQNGPLISPTTFRRLYKPRMRRLVDAIRKKTSAPIYIHSCGSIYPFIPDLIECGIEILNPVQVNAQDMDSGRLKREFGRHLTFWGGGCDPVVLQNGSIQDVEEEVRRRIDDLAPGGGFVFGSVHNIQVNVPTENIVGMFEAAAKYGG